MNKKYYPGRRAEGLQVQEVEVTVFPVGVRHMEQYAAVLITTMKKVGDLGVKYDIVTGELDKESLRNVMPEVVRIVLSDLKQLLIDTTTFSDSEFKFEDLAHFDLPVLASEWLEENFLAEGRLDPWMRTAKKLAERLRSLSTTSSTLSSLLGGGTKRSSTVVSQASRTEDGLSPNGGPALTRRSQPIDVDVDSSSTISSPELWERSVTLDPALSSMTSLGA